MYESIGVGLSQSNLHICVNKISYHRFLREMLLSKFFELDGPREEHIMRTFKPSSKPVTSDQ